ncbi:hypothetical protein N3K66_006820 [Trichothecium roseum]|uniref:Uncharacterized protein n=1 Tax=Trichothecium roseum TaxID=47278 RepID=A0ACC0UWD6_9HYPO|nr:hypothetical protein N3K66_006820 [Trichothecium roseum]
MKPATDARILRPNKMKLEPVDHKVEVPRLAHKLEQVLFTQGPNQLQDPRTQVFNFDPYLASIMPVDEFDFAALKEYITSSKDTRLRDMAKELGKKYCGSTSSMTNVLSHFHYLLSAWRKPNYSALSQAFQVESDDFTRLTRGPAAVYARYQDGVYAIDADKEYDTESILSMLGKSMEKLLTLPKDEFEKYRITRSHQITDEEKNADEAFHYTTLGDFMMRSQLDAYDPRLPGEGVFDLKTRAVVSIRMDVQGYEKGQGYEIRYFRGQWESFEREYYDLIRAAFLKYSLQVRMGRMDGIFVAYHNTKRIFGFQYISLEEMDMALHGTTDRALGDAEFKASISLLNNLLDRATARWPERSLRLYVETRPTKVPLTYFFVTPVTDEEIQTSKKSSQAAAERTAERLEEISRHQQGPDWETKVAEGEKPESATDEVPDELPDQPATNDLESDQVWDELMTAVKEAVEKDSQGLTSVREALKDALAQNNLLSDSTTEESKQYVDALVDALTSNSTALGETPEISEDKNVDSTDEIPQPDPVPVDGSVIGADAEVTASEESPVLDNEAENKSTDRHTLLKDLIVKVTGRIEERTTELRTFEKVIAELAARSKPTIEPTESDSTRQIAESQSDDAATDEVLVTNLQSVDSQQEVISTDTADEHATAEDTAAGETSTTEEATSVEETSTAGEATSVEEPSAEQNSDEETIVSAEGASAAEETLTAEETTAESASPKDTTPEATVSEVASPEEVVIEDTIAEETVDEDMIDEDMTVEDEMDGESADGATADPAMKPPRELLGMYVTVRNKCGGKFVERPTGEDAKDWSIQYSVTELSQKQARSIFASIQTRRKKTLFIDATDKDAQWYRAWGGKMSEVTKQGEEYRDLMNKQGHGKPVYVSWGEAPISPEEAYTYDPDALRAVENDGYRPKYEEDTEVWEEPDYSEPTGKVDEGGVEKP